MTQAIRAALNLSYRLVETSTADIRGHLKGLENMISIVSVDEDDAFSTISIPDLFILWWVYK